MAEADLDVVIRRLAKQQNASLMAAAKGRRDRFISLEDSAQITITVHKIKLLAKNPSLFCDDAMKLRPLEELLFRSRIEDKNLERFQEVKTVGHSSGGIDHGGQSCLAQ